MAMTRTRLRPMASERDPNTRSAGAMLSVYVAKTAVTVSGERSNASTYLGNNTGGMLTPMVTMVRTDAAAAKAHHLSGDPAPVGRSSVASDAGRLIRRIDPTSHRAGGLLAPAALTRC